MANAVSAASQQVIDAAELRQGRVTSPRTPNRIRATMRWKRVNGSIANLRMAGTDFR